MDRVFFTENNIDAEITKVQLKNIGRRFVIRIGDKFLGGKRSAIEKIAAGDRQPRQDRLKTLTRKLLCETEVLESEEEEEDI